MFNNGEESEVPFGFGAHTVEIPFGGGTVDEGVGGHGDAFDDAFVGEDLDGAGRFADFVSMASLKSAPGTRASVGGLRTRKAAATLV